MALNLIPALKGYGRHRGKTPTQLRAELDQATCQIVALATEIDELKAERNDMAGELDKAAIDYSDLLEDRDEWREQALALWDRFGPQIAEEANANKVSVPPAYRDTTDPADQATQPIPVITRVVPLYEAPFAAEPVFEPLPASVDPTVVPASALRP